jgi:hypothetical protein
MGKNNKNKKQTKQQPTSDQHVHSAACQHDHHPQPAEEDGTEGVPEVEGKVLSPEEKAAQYKEMQQQVFENFIKDFEAEEASLLAENKDILERQRDIDKREREEIKRLEKTVFKKD